MRKLYKITSTDGPRWNVKEIGSGMNTDELDRDPTESILDVDGSISDDMEEIEDSIAKGRIVVIIEDIVQFCLKFNILPCVLDIVPPDNYEEDVFDLFTEISDN